jgi:hypothetical protein
MLKLHICLHELKQNLGYIWARRTSFRVMGKNLMSETGIFGSKMVAEE